MKPARFRYLAPRDEAELLATLAEHGEEARPLAGGQSLVPMMNFRLVSPSLLVDLNGLKDWAYITEQPGSLSIGALTRQAALEDSPVVRERCPLLSEAVQYVAHRQIRNRGTIGGSLALAYPGAELPAVVATLRGQLRLRSLRGERLLAAEDFFVGPLETRLAADEVIAEILLPTIPSGAGSAFVEVSRRHGDYALASAAAVIALGNDGRVRSARLGVTGGTGVPQVLPTLETALIGRSPVDDFRALSQQAAASLDLLDDAQVPVTYRRRLIATTLRRALELAASRAEVERAH